MNLLVSRPIRKALRFVSRARDPLVDSTDVLLALWGQFYLKGIPVILVAKGLASPTPCCTISGFDGIVIESQVLRRQDFVWFDDPYNVAGTASLPLGRLR